MRHLHIPEGSNEMSIRDEEWLKKLEEFIKINRGKRYRLNPMNLIKQSLSKSPTPLHRPLSTQSGPLEGMNARMDQTTGEEEEEEGFFCSELVAAAY